MKKRYTHNKTYMLKTHTHTHTYTHIQIHKNNTTTEIVFKTSITKKGKKMMKKGTFFCFKVIIGSKEKIRKEKKNKKERKKKKQRSENKNNLL